MDTREHEQSGFTEGLTETYRDGVRVAHDAVPAQSSSQPPPEGLTAQELGRFRELVEEERAISNRRRRLHDRIAFVRSEGSDAGTTGTDLDYLLERERELSARRKELHRAIDEMRRDAR